MSVRTLGKGGFEEVAVTRCALFKLGKAGGESSSRSRSVSVAEPSSSSSSSALSGGGEWRLKVGTSGSCVVAVVEGEDEIPLDSQLRRYDAMVKKSMRVVVVGEDESVERLR